MSSFAHDRNILLSLFVHGLLGGLILGKDFLFSSTSSAPPHIPTLRVDWVELPRAVSQELPEWMPRTAVSSLKKSKAVAPKNTEMHGVSPQGSFLEKNKRVIARMKAFKKLETLEDGSDLISGNRLSSGSNLSGEAKEGSEDHYLDFLRNQVHQHFNIPIWMQRQKLTTQIQVFFNPQGILEKMILIQSSGHLQFDEAAQRAILDSQPFPLPPEGVHPRFFQDGIIFGFPL